MADFGLTEDMYGTNYFRRNRNDTQSEEKVPIRWMAPESIENDIYDESTDVVSKLCFLFFILLIPERRHIRECSFCSYVVVIWCHSLGDIYMWKSALLWNQSHECVGNTSFRR